MTLIKQTKNTWKHLGLSEFQMTETIKFIPEQLGSRISQALFPGARNRGFLDGFPHVGGGLMVADSDLGMDGFPSRLPAAVASSASPSPWPPVIPTPPACASLNL